MPTASGSIARGNGRGARARYGEVPSAHGGLLAAVGHEDLAQSTDIDGFAAVRRPVGRSVLTESRAVEAVAPSHPRIASSGGPRTIRRSPTIAAVPVQIAARARIRPLRSRRRRKVGLIDSARATSLTPHGVRHPRQFVDRVCAALGLRGGLPLGRLPRRTRIRASSFGETGPI
jgi:hypothetical protein